MKRILYTFLTLSALTLLNSCGDFLGNTPKGFTIPSKVEDYQKLLANNSQMNNTLVDNMEILSDNVKLLNADATATRYSFVGKGENVQNVYSFKPGDFYPAGTVDYNWKYAYSRIFTWNTVINNVMASVGDDRMKQSLKAEALFGRAYDYFMLVNTYGKHYNKATASSDYGVPLILVDDINYKITKRESVQEVYDKILADLNEAAPHIPASVAFINHPSQCALYAFYAKIYLFMGEYEKALENANKALGINSNLLNLNDYVMKTGSTWDRVVLASDNKVRYPDITHPEYIYARWASGSLQGAVMLSESLRATFKKDIAHDTTDLRKYYFASEDMVDFGGTPDYFKGECAYVLYAYVNTGLSTVETKLIAAECEARVGDYAKAITHLNEIRDKRFNKKLTKAEYHLSAPNKEEALLKVLDERRREMMMKNTRLFDIKRLNMDPATQITYSHSADGQTWTMQPNSNLLIFPINNVIMEFNPDMPQYDRK